MLSKYMHAVAGRHVHRKATKRGLLLPVRHCWGTHQKTLSLGTLHTVEGAPTLRHFMHAVAGRHVQQRQEVCWAGYVDSATEHTAIAKCPLGNASLRYSRQDLHSLVQQGDRPSSLCTYKGGNQC